MMQIMMFSEYEFHETVVANVHETWSTWQVSLSTIQYYPV